MNKKLTYKDFKIGQRVMLVKELPLDNGSEVGVMYEITDLDFHFPNSICIRIINEKEDVDFSGFFNIEYFDTVSAVRESNLKDILDD